MTRVNVHKASGDQLSARVIADRCLLDKECQLFYGKSGTRKSSLGLAIVREGVVHFGFRRFLTTWSRFKHRIRNCRSWNFQTETVEDIMNQMMNADIVFIDELGMEEGYVNEEDRQIFFEMMSLIEGSNKLFLMTTNLTLEQLKDKFGPEIYGRLTHKNRVVTKCFDGEQDYRAL